MNKRKDIKVGSIVPIYYDPHEELKFRGMAELIEKVDTESQHYIKDEKKKPVSTSIDIGKRVYIKGNTCEYEITYLDNDGCVLSVVKNNSSGHEIYVPLPSTELIDAIKIGEEIIVNDINYIVINDTDSYTEVVTQKDHDENNVHLIQKIEKPFSYTIESYSPHHYVYRTEKWRVRLLANPFYGEIEVGNSLYYKDLGLLIVVSKENGKIKLKHKNSLDIFTVDTKDLFTAEKFTLTTIATVSYRLKIGSRYYEKIIKQKDRVINDEWD